MSLTNSATASNHAFNALGIRCSYETSTDSTIAGGVSGDILVSGNDEDPVADSTEHQYLLDADPKILHSPTTAGSQATASLGYADDKSGTRSIMDVLGGGHLQHGAPQPKSISDVASRYKVLVRQLPPKDCIDQLVRVYFAEVSWQYDVVDETIFREQLLAWELTTYAARSQPQRLDPTVRYFPSLLFQVLAQALLTKPRGIDSFLKVLCPAPDMNLSDLAAEFSDAGRQILSLLGPTEPALVKVQAGLQRATFLKSTGSVVEAWHVLGSAIRDAQELGIHRLHSSLGQGIQSNREQARFVETGRRMWLVLHLWDAHMGVVLGRPMVTRLDPNTVPFPHGTCSNDTDSAGLAQQAVPFDVILCGYHTAYKHLQDIDKLEPWKPDVFATVDHINATILAGIGQMPVWARFSSPVHDEQSAWLPAARETLVTEINFTLLALHRPFIFVRARSRIEALKAALEVLQSQSRLLRASDFPRPPAFSFVFATFDATVIVMAIYIIFPNENPEYLQRSLQCVLWALEKLHAMKAQSTLAASAHSAVHEVYEKLMTSISNAYIPHTLSPNTETRYSHGTAGQSGPGQMDTAAFQLRLASDHPQELANMLPQHEMLPQDSTKVPMNHHDTATDSTAGAHTVAHDVSFPDYGNILPPLPLHDLIWGHSTTKVPSMYHQDGTTDDTGEGDAATHDFWQVLDSLGK
ncbi:hypothetical protein Q7P37_009095 [Cladosporium fusiforme]